MRKRRVRRHRPRGSHGGREESRTALAKQFEIRILGAPWKKPFEHRKRSMSNRPSRCLQSAKSGTESKLFLVPLFSLPLREVLAHVRALQVDVAHAGGDAAQDGVGHELALDAQLPLVGLQLGGDQHLHPLLERVSIVGFVRHVKPIAIPRCADRRTTFRRYPEPGFRALSFLRTDLARRAPMTIERKERQWSSTERSSGLAINSATM